LNNDFGVHQEALFEKEEKSQTTKKSIHFTPVAQLYTFLF
jgi:hypothetical protein